MYNRIFVVDSAIFRTEKTFDNDVEYINKDYLINILKEEKAQIKRYLEKGGEDKLLYLVPLNTIDGIIEKLN